MDQPLNISKTKTNISYYIKARRMMLNFQKVAENASYGSYKKKYSTEEEALHKNM